VPAVAHTQTAPGNKISILSLSQRGAQVSGVSGSFSYPPAVSADGNLIAFESLDPGLLPDDTNGLSDIFLRIRDSGLITRINMDSANTQANGDSFGPAMSADGRFVVFQSLASGLAGDANAAPDILLWERETGAVSRISSAGGSAGNAASWRPSISADGRFVAFCSAAADLVRDDTNSGPDAFRLDRQTGEMTRASVDGSGRQTGGGCTRTAISADGRFVVFQSAAADLVEGDTNGLPDVFRKDMQSGQIARVSVDAGGGQANGASGTEGVSISEDSRFVAFDSVASNLVADDSNGAADVFVRDVDGAKTQRVSVSSEGAEGAGDSGTGGLAMAGGGRYVVFASRAPNLVAGDANGSSDIFLRDMQSGRTSIVTATPSSAPANEASYGPAIDRDGGVIAFASLASNLIFGDRNYQPDIYVSSGEVTTTSLVPAPATPGSANAGSSLPVPEHGNGPLLPTGAYVALGAAALALAVYVAMRLRRRPQES
jgi:Tol biopolymer transport system component